MTKERGDVFFKKATIVDCRYHWLCVFCDESIERKGSVCLYCGFHEELDFVETDFDHPNVKRVNELLAVIAKERRDCEG